MNTQLRELSAVETEQIAGGGLLGNISQLIQGDLSQAGSAINNALSQVDLPAGVNVRDLTNILFQIVTDLNDN